MAIVFSGELEARNRVNVETLMSSIAVNRTGRKLESAITLNDMCFRVAKAIGISGEWYPHIVANSFKEIVKNGGNIIMYAENPNHAIAAILYMILTGESHYSIAKNVPLAIRSEINGIRKVAESALSDPAALSKIFGVSEIEIVDSGKEI